MSGNPQGSEFRINLTTANSQRTNPASTVPYTPRAIASDSVGNFVVAWTSQAQDLSGGGIYVRLFNSAGEPLPGAPVEEIQVNTTTANEQRLASVAMADNGDFVVVWRSFQDDNSLPLGTPDSWGIYAQRFNRLGEPQGGEIQVASTTFNEDQPSVAMDADGDFVITWTGGSGNDIYAARFDKAVQNPTVTSTVVNTTTTGNQQLSTVAMAQDGSYVVVWTSNGQDGSGDDIYGQRFDASGATIGAEFRINVETNSNQRNPSVSMDQSGNFVVAWASENQDTSQYGIYYRRFDSTGQALDATDQRANDTIIGDQNYPTVSYERDGDSFVISWSSTLQPEDGDGTAVVVRRYNEFGTAQGSEVLANSYTLGIQEYPSVAIDAESDFVVVWSTEKAGTDEVGFGIYGQRFGRDSATAPTDIDLAPVATEQGLPAVNENAAVGTVVGTLTAKDPDTAAAGLSFTLVNEFGFDAGAFTLVETATGVELRLQETPDFEVKPSYRVKIQVTDGTDTYDEVYEIRVVNSPFELPPTAIVLSSTSVNENVPDNTVVATLSAEDPEPGDSFTYALIDGIGGDDNSAFEIVGDQLQIRSSPDFETKNSYKILLQATDQGGNTYQEAVVIAINDWFEVPPTSISLDGSTVNENATPGTLVANVTGTDPETGLGDVLTFSLVPNVDDNAAFSLVNGQLRVATPPDFEDQQTYTIQVLATDRGGQTFTDTFTINVINTPFELAPTAINLDGTSVAENVPANTVIGSVTGTDPETVDGDALTFSLVEGELDNSAFRLINGELQIVASPDYEAKSSYRVLIRATDRGNNTFDQEFTINVTDSLFESRPTSLTLDRTRVDENVAANSVVATITGVDPDAGDTLTYSLVEGFGDNALFNINNDDDSLRINDSPDFETKPSYNIRLRVTDAANNTFDQDFTIEVNNLFEEDPTSISLSSLTVDENVAAGTRVAIVTGTDPETAIGDVLTFSLRPDFGNNSAFTLENGELKIVASPDFETQATYLVGLQARDAGGNVLDRDFVINVIDTPFELAPTNIELSANSVAENVAVTTVIGTVTGTDAEVGAGGDVLTFSLVPDAANNNAFSLVDGQLRFLSSPDYEAQSSYTVLIRATDRGNNSLDREFTINVTDVQFELAPTSLTIDETSVDENVPGNTVVATILGSDPEVGDTLTYSLVDDLGDNAFFNVNGNQLRITNPPDFEAKPSYNIRLRVTDSGNNAFEESFTISVNNLFELRPNDLDLDRTSVNENVPVNTVVATISGLDPEFAIGDALTFSLPSGGTDDNANFAIAGNQLQILVSPDYENKTSYIINLRATDRGGNTYDEVFTIEVNDRLFEQRPTDIRLDTTTVNENVAANTAIATLSAVDPDVGDTFTFSLVPDSFDNAAFTVVGNQLQINSPPDFEVKASYTILLRVTDGGGNTFDKEFTIEVNNLFDIAPTGLSLNGNTVTENATVGTAIGTVSATDPEVGDVLTYSLVPNFGDNAFFTLENGSLAIAESPDFEVRPSYNIRVQVTDRGNNTDVEDFTITVNNLFDEDPTDITLDSTTIAENAGANALVANIQGTDPEVGDSLTFSLTPAFGDNGAFSIVNNQLLINDSPDFEGQASYRVSIRATDRGANFYDEEFTITVSNNPFDRRPTSLSLSATTVTENVGANFNVATITGIDPDPDDLLTYTLVSGAGDGDNGAFTVDGNRLLINASPDFENKQSYNIRLRATDQANNTFEETFTINVTNIVYELAPTNIDLSATTVAENVPANFVVATVSGQDPETGAGDSLTFSLLPNTGDNAAFTLNGTDLQINASPNFEAKSSYSITLRATDRGGNFYDETLTINVTDIVFELAPTDILLSSTAVNENVVANTVVATLSGSDPEGSDRLTFSLVAGIGDTDNSAFTIVSNQLRINASPDFETRPSYSIRLRATDQGNNTYDEVVTITVNNLPEGLAPDDIILSSNRVDENVNPGTVVGTLSATDPDGNNGFVFSLVNAPGYDTSAFTIVGNELQMAVRPDYETKSLYRIKVRVQDPGGLAREEDFIISVNDRPENRTPTDISLTSTAIAENSPADSIVGTLVTTDPDTGDTFTYTLVDEPGLDTARFTIVNNTLRINTIPDYETQSSYTIRIRTTDSGNLSREEVFTITVLDRQETSPPTLLNLSSTSVTENVPAGSVVGTLSAVDPDPGESITYTLVDENGTTDNAAFQIVGNQLRIVASPDYETKTSYTVQVRATDLQGNSIENTFAIAVLDQQDTIGNANLPTLDLNGDEAGVNYTAPFTPGVPVRLMSDAATLSDSDSANLVSALVAISNPLNTPNEILSVDVSGTNIRATYEATGALTLTGNASLADYLRVLKTVTYNNTISVPGDDPRTLVFVLDDGVNTNEVAITQLIPTATNTINGTIGNDPSLVTTARTDLLTALAGDDVVTSTLANLQQDDRLDGGDGVDTLRITDGTGSLVVNVGLTTSQVTGMDPETQVFNFENFNLSGFQGTSRMIGSSVRGDVFVGGAGNDNLSGLGGNDNLSAGAGNDVLNGGVGNDTLFGGGGNDVYIVDSLLDVVLEGANAGNDQIRSSVNYALGANQESLLLTGVARVGLGNALGNRITGNGANNRIDGRAGNDVLLGGRGADVLLGGAGNDVLAGEVGRDVLNGGLGSDRFVISAARDSRGDTIQDFNSVSDVMQISLGTLRTLIPAGVPNTLRGGTLARTQFTLGAVARNSVQRFVYDRTNGNLYFDPDGNGAIAQTFIVRLQGGVAINNTDISITA